MHWFYSSDGRQLGPVSDQQLDELLAAGTINRDSLVWREGMAEWQPLHTVRATVPAPPAPTTPGGVVCVECGRTFPQGEVIQLSGLWTCAQCKPVVLQKMIEGVSPAAGAASLWRTKKQLVTRSGTAFPDRCVKCNAPAGGFKLKRVLYWQHPAWYFLLLCNLLVLLVVIMIVRKKAELHIGLCEVHRAARRRTILIGWLGSVGGVVLAIAGGVGFNSGWPVAIGILVFLITIIYAGVKAPMVSAAKITPENVWLRGVHRDFLDTLPEWPGP